MPGAAELDRQGAVVRAPGDPDGDAEVVPRRAVVAGIQMVDEGAVDAAGCRALDQVVGGSRRHPLRVRDQVAKRELAQSRPAGKKLGMTCRERTEAARVLEDAARPLRRGGRLPSPRRPEAGNPLRPPPAPQPRPPPTPPAGGLAGGPPLA